MADGVWRTWSWSPGHSIPGALEFVLDNGEVVIQFAISDDQRTVVWFRTHGHWVNMRKPVVARTTEEVQAWAVATWRML